MPRIVTITMNPAIDKSTGVQHVAAEKKLRCRPPHFNPGGGGVNVSRAIHQLGGESLALWSRGGAVGEVFESLLNEERISHEPVPIAGATRQNLIVFEDASQQQYRFGMPGPELNEDDLACWLEAIDNLDPAPDYLVISGSLPPGVRTDFYGRIADRLPPASRVIVDAKELPLQEAVGARIYLIKPNLAEFSDLAGRKLDGDQAIVLRANSLIDEGKVEVVVVSLGSGGALLVTADTARHVRSPTVPIRSKVGAGDSMVAGIVLSLARGRSVPDAVAFGVAAGASAVTTPGTELCRRDEAEKLYRQIAAREPDAETIT